jgi:hypothetical protein
MEVGLGSNEGCSAKGKENNSSESNVRLVSYEICNFFMKPEGSLRSLHYLTGLNPEPDESSAHFQT